MTTVVSRTAVRLGWAGLLPFLAAPLAMHLFESHVNAIADAIAVYSLAILCFLAGAWWGIALLRQQPGVLVVSNLLVVIACSGFLLLHRQTSLVLLAILFFCTVGLERLHPMFSPQPEYYARLRLCLSSVAAMTLLLSAYTI